MTAIAFAFAAVAFLLWLIEHVGGRQQRDDLREQLRAANETVESLTEILRVVMRGGRKTSRSLRVVKGGES